MKAVCTRWLGLLALLMGAHATLQAQTDLVPPVETGTDARSALRAERQQQSQVLDTQERACYQRFFTTACLDEVARARRAMLADIKHKEAALDAADRHQRAQDELQRQNEKQQAHEAQLQAMDPADVERAQHEKQTERDAKLRDHAAQAIPAPVAQAASQAKAPKLPSGPSAPQRAANQAAFDKKQMEAKRRLAEREQARADSASPAASAPRSLPLPVPAQ